MRVFSRPVGRVDRRWPSVRSLGVASPRRRRACVAAARIRLHRARRRRARHLSSTPHLSSSRSASRRRQLLSSTLLPPLVDAAPRRVAPHVAATPLVTTTPLSPHSSPPHLSSDLSSMPRLLCVVPLLSSTPLLSSMPRLLAAATSSYPPASPPAPLVPLHMYTCFSSVCRGTVCVFGERCVNVLLCT